MPNTCTRCNTPILKGEKYHRTPKGPHHATCPHVSVAIPNDGGPAVVTRDDKHASLDIYDLENINKARSTAWAAYQVLGCFFGINGPARIMNWFNDIAHGEMREAAELFPITESERSKYSWSDRHPTNRERLVAEFAYKCCEKGDNIQMMWQRLEEMFRK